MPRPTPEAIAAEMRELVTDSNLSPAEVRLLLVQTALARVETFMLNLDLHVASDHSDDASSQLVIETIDIVRHELRMQLRIAATAADMVLQP